MGRISIEAGKADQAISSFERAIAINPAFEPAYLAQASFYESRQEKDKAIGVLQKYLQRVNPRNKEIRQHLIQLYVATANPDALAFWESVGMRPYMHVLHQELLPSASEETPASESEGQKPPASFLSGLFRPRTR